MFTHALNAAFENLTQSTPRRPSPAQLGVDVGARVGFRQSGCPRDTGFRKGLDSLPFDQASSESCRPQPSLKLGQGDHAAMSARKSRKRLLSGWPRGPLGGKTALVDDVSAMFIVVRLVAVRIVGSREETSPSAPGAPHLAEQTCSTPVAFQRAPSAAMSARPCRAGSVQVAILKRVISIDLVAAQCAFSAGQSLSSRRG